MNTLKYRLKLFAQKYQIVSYLVTLIRKLKVWISVIWYSKEQRKLFLLKHKNYEKLPLSETSLLSSKRVEETLDRLLKERNSLLSVSYYSNALRKEVVYSFQTAIEHASKTFNQINYLEIGSALGASLSLIANVLREYNLLGRLVSIDPYFEGGYVEGGKGIWNKDRKVDIDESVMQVAMSLYQELGLDVELIRDVSKKGLRSLIDRGEVFQLIYIDGSHEGLNPLIDFALCTQCIDFGAVIMLDDHHWPDVKIVKELCDRHLPKVYESWKVAVYEWKV